MAPLLQLEAVCEPVAHQVLAQSRVVVLAMFRPRFLFLHEAQRHIDTCLACRVVGVARLAHAEGLAAEPLPDNLEEALAARMYDPLYREDEFREP